MYIYILQIYAHYIIYFHTKLTEDLSPSPDPCCPPVRVLPLGSTQSSPFVRTQACDPGHELWQVEREVRCDLEGEAQTLLCPLPQIYPFLPTVVDGVLLPKMPEEMLAEKNFNPVPYIVGINKQEFGWILPLVRKNRVISRARHITLPSVVTDLSLGPGQLSPSYKLTFPWKPSLMVHTVIWEM